MAQSETPVIETVMRSEPSLVGITAFRMDYASKHNRSVSLQKRGAGVIIHPSGLIITNVHTIYNSNKITVELSDKTQLPAEIVNVLPDYDLALIRVTPASPLVPIAMGNSDQVKLGDRVINVGHSWLLNKTISGGVVVGLGHRIEGNEKKIEFIKVDMELYKGDSGGPLLDEKGRLIGLIMATVLKSDKSLLAIATNRLLELSGEY